MVPWNLSVVSFMCSLAQLQAFVMLSRQLMERTPTMHLSALPPQLALLADPLRDSFNITKLTKMQSELLEEEARDLVVVAQTGSGKSLTFLLPMLLQSKCSVVLAPNRWLLQQHKQAAYCLKLDHNISFFTPNEWMLSRSIDSSLPAILALDEVDALLYVKALTQTDETLSPQGEMLWDVVDSMKRSSRIRIIATTAYLSPQHESALLSQHFPNARVWREGNQGKNGWLVPTLRQVFQYFSTDKMSKLENILGQAADDVFLAEGSTMVFCNTADTATLVCGRLRQSGGNGFDPDNILLLHEELMMASSNESKTFDEPLSRIKSDPTTPFLLVCSDLAARGLDIPNVRHVILYDVPIDVASFVHQVGRTARKGQQGVATCLIQQQSGDMGRYTQLHALKDASPVAFD